VPGSFLESEMKAAILMLLVPILLSVVVCAQAAKPDNPNRSADEQEILRKINEINDAYVSRNYGPFESIYLERYIAVRSRPQYNYRNQLIAMMKADARDIAAGKKLNYQTISFESANPQIRFFGDTAIVTAEKKNLWRYKVDKCLTRYQATEVWVKQDNSWRLAASHTSTFQCENPPFYPPHPAVAQIPSQSAPHANKDLQADVTIRTLIDLLGANRSPEDERIFADNFVFTNTRGETTGGKTDLLSAIQARSNSPLRLSRRDEALQIFDDTAIFMFRIKQKTGTNDAESPIQGSIVLVNLLGKWQIVAAHLSKITTD
jgi:hypothetical protein